MKAFRKIVSVVVSVMMMMMMMMMMVPTTHADTVCTQTSMCKCMTDKGAIDLTPLASQKLTCTDQNGGVKFQYNPCSDNKTDCLDASLCMTKGFSSDHEAIGKSSGQTFINKGQDVAIEYPGDDNKTSIVILKCDQSKEGDLTMVTSDDSSFEFQLASRYACVGGPASPTTSKSTPKGSTTTPKTTPKTTKTTPKTTKTTPKTTKTTPKTTKTTPKTTKTTPKSTKTTPKGTKTTPKSTKTTPKGTKTTPKSTKTTPKGTKTTPKSKSSTTPRNTPTTPKHGGASSIYSFKMAAASILLVICRQLFF